MKKIKPSPVAVMISGALFACSLVYACYHYSFYNMFTDKEVGTVILILAVVFFSFLAAYLFGEKIEFDEETFTVGSKIYKFSEISKVEVEPTMVVRGIPTFEIEVYVGDKAVCVFTKAQAGSDEFIEVMKKHGVKISIDI